MTGKKSLFTILVFLLAIAGSRAVTNSWVYYGANGLLNYQTWGDGNQIMDFSWAGYMGGGVAIPTNIVVKTNLTAVAGDNTASIQGAINYVSSLPLNANGIRGAVLLAPGTFSVSNQINISASGVVVWGSGSGVGGTIILMTNAPFTLFNISGSGGPSQGGAVAITDPYVPSGATTFHIATGSTIITWGTNTTIAADSDVFTNGTLLYAYDWAGNNTTVNGVAFTGTSSATPANVSVSGIGNNYTGYTSTLAPFSSLSTEYQSILSGGEYGGGGVTATVTLKNLTVGHVYAVQVWVSDPRSGGVDGRTENVSSSNTVVLAYNVPPQAGGVGQYTIGTFTATASSQAFSLQTTNSSGSTQLNALLVSDVTTTGYQPTNPPTTPGTSPFTVGETVMINRTVTTNWINYVGMTPGGGSILTNQVWIAPGTVIMTDRIIQQANGNQITLDAPLTDSFDTNYLGIPGGTIAPYTWSGRISQVGLEHLFVVAPPGNNGYITASLGNIIDSWVRDINIQDGVNNFNVDNSAKRCTVDSVNITHTVPFSPPDPPTDFTVTGTQILLNKCTSQSSGEWVFVTQGEGTGPIVMLNFYTTGDRGMEPHQRWTTGLLCDNCSLPDCPSSEQGVAFFNRGSDGSGHGWDMGWGVEWNCVTPYFLNTVAAGTENWFIGGTGEETSNGQVNGIYNETGNIVTPQSLYLAQLKQRLGPVALQNIGYQVFTMSPSPSIESVMPGSNITVTINVAGTNGFSDTIGLSIGGVPAGVGAQLSTNSVSGIGSSTLSLSISNSAAPGNYQLAINGIDGNLTNTTIVNLTVANFSLSATPASQTVIAGATNITYTVTAETNDSFAGAISFDSSVASGASASFNPASLSGAGTSTLTLNAGSLPVGTDTLTIAGTNGSVVVDTTVNLVVTPAALVWTGTNTTNPNNWDSVSYNWNNSNGVAVLYSQGDLVTFNDSAPGPTNIYLTTILTPGSLTVSNTVLAYNLGSGGQGGGRISGTTGLVKQGNNLLILDENNDSGNYNDFSGGLLISAGTVQMGNGDQNGAVGTGPVTNNGALVFDRVDSVTVPGVISGSGPVTQEGLGTVTLSATETYTGATIVTNGTLALDAGNNTDSGIYKSSGLTINNGGTVQINIDNSLTGNGDNAVPITINNGGTLTGLSSADSGAGTSTHVRGLLTLNGGNLAMAGTEAQPSYGNWDLDGGVATAGGPNTSIISAYEVDPSKSGGTTFNIPQGTTSSGIDLNVTGGFFHGTSEGDTGIIKLGSGALELSGTNSYTGNTFVDAGKLVLSGSGNVNSSALVAVSGATLDISGLAGAASNSQFSLTNATLVLGIPAAGSTNEMTSTLNLGGATNVVNIVSLPAITTLPQIFHLISYTALNGAFNVGLGSVPSLPSGSTADVTSENDFIDLVIAPSNGVATLAWTGTDPGNPNNWDVGISYNWQTNGVATTYSQGATVRFDDTATGQTNINLMTLLTPFSVTVSNSVLAYNLGNGGTGSGRISGSAGLTKQGTNVLILDEANSSGNYNDFSGGLTISAGTVQVGNSDRNGAVGSGAVNDSGALVFDRVDNITNANVISGTGSLAQEGTGVLTLSGANSYSGTTLIQNGTVRVGTNSAFGPVSGGAVTITNDGTMDIGEPSFGNQSFILGLKQIYVSGWGVSSNGAIINSSTNWQYANSNLLLVTMQGDTAIGGAGQATPGNGNTGGRWDLRGTSTQAAMLSTGGHPYNLFKMGGNQIVLVDATVDPNLANIDVRQGFLEVQGFTTLGNTSSNLTVETGATFGSFQGTNLNKNFVLNGNGLTYTIFTEGASNALVGPVVLNSGNCVFGGSKNLALSNSVSGNANLVVSNSTGTVLFLAGTNTYSGNTLVLEGTLALAGNGSISNSQVITVGSGALLDASQRTGGTLTLASGQTLTGNGAVKGNVVAGSGSTFEPGVGIGTLVLSNNLTLNGGSTMLIAINKSLSPSNSMAQITGAVTYGGTLMITNLGAQAFAAGDSFKLFNASSYSGAFASVVPAIPGINLAWNTNTLSSGVLSVVALPTPSPQIVTTVMSGNNFIFSGSNGVPGWPYWVLSSSNLSLPISEWTIVSTNSFDGSGNFIFTNPANLNLPQTFYILEIP